MGGESQRKYEVFISYSSKDKRWADAACAVLERDRIRCWVAPRDISPGTEWGAAIISGMDASKMMVLIFSNHANESPQVRREVERAISKGLIVLPFRVEDVKPAGAMEFALSNTHWLDGFTPPLERRLGKLAKSVKDLLANDPGEAAESPAPPVNPRPSAVSAPPGADSPTVDRRPCPICGEMIPATAAKCRFCGEIFDSTLTNANKKTKLEGIYNVVKEAKKEEKQRAGETGELREIASLRKNLVLCAFVSIVSTVFLFASAIYSPLYASTPAPLLVTDFFLMLCALPAATIGALVLSVKLANRLHGTGATILVFFLCLVPGVWYIPWFVLSYQAAAVLREKGFTVGFVGAPKSAP